MKTSHTSSIHLAHFPADVLGLILSYQDSSYLAIDLWKCGDKNLNAKLASSVYHVELRAPRDSHNRYPLLLSLLRGLRHLDLWSSNKIFLDDQQCATELKKLPECLQTLKFDAPGFESFVSANRNCGALKELLPSALSSLSLTLPLGVLEIATECFPSSLTQLGLQVIFVTGSTPFFSNLPRGLRFLDCVLQVRFGENNDTSILQDFASAPPQLERISDIRYRGHPAGVEGLSWLPRSLTECSMRMFSWDPLQASTIPPNIVKLDIKYAEMEEFASEHKSFVGTLPRSLRKLDLYASDFSECLPEATALSNKTDTQGQLIYDRDLLSSIHRLWPSKLTSLEIRTESFRTADFSLLPPSLLSSRVSCTYFESATGSHESVDFDSLLPNLTSLDVGCEAGDAPNFIGTLPAALIALIVRGTSDGVDLLKKLPTTLTSLEGEFMDEDSAVMANDDVDAPQSTDFVLPGSLTRLTVQVWRSDFLSLLPSTVTDLVVHHLFLHGTDSHVYHLTDIPTHIKELQLTVFLASKLKDRFQLPAHCFDAHPDLKILYIDGNYEISSKSLRSLPRRMLGLQLFLDAMPAEDKPYIPGGLGTCYFGTSVTI